LLKLNEKLPQEVTILTKEALPKGKDQYN
jgi:hypothetical protein